MTDKKFELTETTIEHEGRTLYRIKALRDFANVKAGDLGGYLETESNLSHEGDAWLYDNARVFGNARVSEDVRVYNNVWVYGNARVYGCMKLHDNVRVYGNVRLCGDRRRDGRLYGNAQVSDDLTS